MADPRTNQQHGFATLAVQVAALDYELRRKANHQVKLAGSNIWQPLGSLIHQSGQSIWLEPAVLTAKYAHPTNLLLHWKAGEDEPWLLATNLPSRRDALGAWHTAKQSQELPGRAAKSGSGCLNHARFSVQIGMEGAILHVRLNQYERRKV